MSTEQLPTRLNRMVIMIVIGTFTLAELLYLAPEYTWGLKKAWVVVATIFK